MSAARKPSNTPAYRREPQQKRELLLSAARDLFATQGFEATSTVQIAKQAGVSEGILFHHFGSKKGLLMQLAEQFAEEAALATMPEDATGMTEESVVRNAFAFAEANPALYDLLSRGTDGMATDIAANSDIIVAAIEKNLRSAMAAAQVRQGNAHIMAQLQFAVVDSAYKAWRRNADPKLKEAYIVEAINCMKAMLAPRH